MRHPLSQTLLRIPSYPWSRLPLRRSFAAIARPRPWWSLLSSPQEQTVEEALEREAGDQAVNTREIGIALQARLKQAQQEEVIVRVDRIWSKSLQVRRLNQYLAQANTNPKDEEIRKQLWRWYCHAKFAIPGLLQALPDKAWDLLWETQSQKSPSNPNSMDHLKQLVEDMQKIGRTATTAQRLAHLEALFVLGHREEALQQWEQENDISSGRSIAGHKPEHLEMGLRMWSIVRNPERAQKILIELFALAPDWDPRVIIPVFEAHIQAGKDANIKLAWGLYTHMKYLLGNKMTLDDYEKCYLGFLYRRQQEYALAVFKEMMLSGQQLRGKDVAKARGRILQGFDNLPAVCGNAEQINEAFLAGLANLPKEWQNKFFFGKWLKRLLGRREMDAAAQVIELMFERGVKPDARHLNGLMGAWLRTGIAENLERAETLGLQMVQERLLLVRSRKDYRSGPKPPQRLGTLFKRKIPFFIERPLPPATSETFGVLLEIYLKQQDWTKVQDLRNWQREAELRMNTPAMNAFLFSHVERGQYLEVWKRYRKLTALSNPGRVFPDEATYNCLWVACHERWRRGGARSLQHLQKHFPMPRIILKDMLNWLNDTRIKSSTARHFVPSNKSYHRIVECFCYSKDLPATLVAIHALKEHLGIYPTQKTATLIAKSIAQSGFRFRSTSQRLRVLGSVAYLRNVGNVLKAFEALLERRVEAMIEEGHSSETMDEHTKSELLLNVLSELIRSALVRQEPREVVENRIAHAKKTMGVPDIGTGDVDSFQVG